MKFVYLLPVILFSCVRPQNDSTTKVQLFIPATPSPASEKSRAIKPQQLNPNGAINPTALADINCYGILTSGPEASMRTNVCRYANSSDPIYVAAFAGGFSPATVADSVLGTTISLEVPSGKDRTIRLIGFKVDVTGSNFTAAQACTNFFGSNAYQKYISQPYQLAEASGLELTPGVDKSVVLTSAFTTNLKIGDCSGPAFNSINQKGGAPSKIGIEIQDGVGKAATPLHADSCVGVKFTLLDANGNRATLATGQNISATVLNSGAGADMGEFFDIQNSNCSSGAVTTDVTLDFFDVSQARNFTDRVYFFRPGSGNSSRNFVVSASGLSVSNLNFTFDSGAGTLTNYAILDVINNRTTQTANAALPMAVRANECRRGLLQFLDANGVPMSYTGGSSNKALLIDDSLAAADDLVFYSTSNDCSSGGENSLSFGSTLSTVYYARSFNYKIKNTVSGNFGLSVVNDGGGSDVITGGEFTAAQHPWMISTD